MKSTVALIRHRVADYDAWKAVYDEFAPTQAEHGVRAHQVLRSTDDPNDIIVIHAFDTPSEAQAFFAMPELKQAMNEAGVEAGSVTISYFDEVEAGTLAAV